jgi:magnesium transporter
MSPQVVAVRRGGTVRQALEQVREGGAGAETIYMIAVLGEGRCLEGVISLRRLLLSEPDELVGTLMTRPVSVLASDDQESAARVILDNRLVAAPVVDAEQRLLGVLTVDDALRVLDREQEEDVARSGGTLPLRRPYLSVGVVALVRSRIAWLLVLVVAATLTVRVLDHFESLLDEVVTLALFVPLLIGTGGNAGAQAATTIVRAMAVGDVRPGDVLRVAGREVITGLLLGVSLSAVGFGPAVIFAGVDVAFVLAISVVAVCTLATAAGSVIPMFARGLGVDPAVVSAPFISTFVDATGLIVYFLVARAVLGL